MKAAFVIPTANPEMCSATFAKWREMGWDTYALVTSRDIAVENATGVFTQDEYPGWGNSFNLMAKWLEGKYDWLATGGDDVLPDPVKDAITICEQCSEVFKCTMGICQPTADKWAFDKNGTAQPICYAPIIGAEFARTWNGGRGAFWPEYFHWFADAELYETANTLLYLWQRDDLYFEHRHPARTGGAMPQYKLNIQHRWQADADLYGRRKHDGYPDHEPAD